MKPSEKTPEMEDTLTRLFGFDRRHSISRNYCVPRPIGCGNLITKEFPDELSKREYQISGLCPDCQEKIFGV
jgi:hypothetical protein